MRQPDQADATGSGVIGLCGPDERSDILRIINLASEAYRGVIASDLWHDPYMAAAALDADIADGVIFFGYRSEHGLGGVMGIQRRSNVTLIRHAYVHPAVQAGGIGSALLRHLCRDVERPILVGTWRAAVWAIRFYETHRFTPVPAESAAVLLQTYWTISDRQRDNSVVLASPALDARGAGALMAGSVEGKAKELCPLDGVRDPRPQRGPKWDERGAEPLALPSNASTCQRPILDAVGFGGVGA